MSIKKSILSVMSLFAAIPAVSASNKQQVPVPISKEASIVRRSSGQSAFYSDEGQLSGVKVSVGGGMASSRLYTGGEITPDNLGLLKDKVTSSETISFQTLGSNGSSKSSFTHANITEEGKDKDSKLTNKFRIHKNAGFRIGIEGVYEGNFDSQGMMYNAGAGIAYRGPTKQETFETVSVSNGAFSAQHDGEEHLTQDLGETSSSTPTGSAFGSGHSFTLRRTVENKGSFELFLVTSIGGSVFSDSGSVEVKLSAGVDITPKDKLLISYECPKNERISDRFVGANKRTELYQNAATSIIQDSICLSGEYKNTKTQYTGFIRIEPTVTLHAGDNIRFAAGVYADYSLSNKVSCAKDVSGFSLKGDRLLYRALADQAQEYKIGEKAQTITNIQRKGFGGGFNITGTWRC